MVLETPVVRRNRAVGAETVEGSEMEKFNQNGRYIRIHWGDEAPGTYTPLEVDQMLEEGIVEDKNGHLKGLSKRVERQEWS